MQCWQVPWNAAGHWTSCCRVSDAASRLLLLPSPTPTQKLRPAYYNRTPSWNPIHASTLACQQHNTTAFQPAASLVSASTSSPSTPCQHVAPASARSLTSMPVCRTICQLGLAAARHKHELDSSGQGLPCCILMVVADIVKQCAEPWR